MADNSIEKFSSFFLFHFLLDIFDGTLTFIFEKKAELKLWVTWLDDVTIEHYESIKWSFRPTFIQCQDKSCWWSLTGLYLNIQVMYHSITDDYVLEIYTSYIKKKRKKIATWQQMQ